METKREDNAKHTPGPWHTEDSRNVPGIDMGLCDHNFQVVSEDGYWLANINKGILQDEANAKLIAAAPLLLESCQNLIKHLEFCYPGHDPEVEKVKAAIKKATE